MDFVKTRAPTTQYTLASSQCLGNGRKLANPTTKPWLSASLGVSKMQLATVTGSKALAKDMSESRNGKESPALFFLVFQKSVLLGRKKPSLHIAFYNF